MRVFIIKKNKTFFKARHVFLVLFSLFVFTNSLADVSSDLNGFFNGLGFSTNVSRPMVYKGQNAGYYSGGSLFMRSRVRNLQVAQINLPSYRAGCGGIDFFSGGFSFINAEKFKQMGLNIMNNAAGYAFNLALETVTPQLANGLKYFQELADKVNQFNINSCETAKGLVGGLWSKTELASRQICQDMGSNNSVFSDWASARQGCGAGGRMSEGLSRAKHDSRYKDMILDNTNLAWRAIQKNGLFSGDPRLAELFMSLSGSVIIKQKKEGGSGDNRTNSFQFLPSLADDASVLKALLHGGTAQIYHCNDTTPDGCLNPDKRTLTISQSNSLEHKVRQLLDGMVSKIYEDTPLSPAEIGLLQATSLPIYKMLNVQAAFMGNHAALDVGQYSDVIAADILFQYLQESLHIVRHGAGVLQFPKVVMQDFLKGIDTALTQVRTTRGNAYHQMAMSVQLIQQTQVIEKLLAGQLSSNIAHSLEWARGMH